MYKSQGNAVGHEHAIIAALKGQAIVAQGNALGYNVAMNGAL